MSAFRLRADQRLFLSYLLLISGLVVAFVAGAEWLLRRRMTAVFEQQLASEAALGLAFYEASDELPTDSVADLLGNLSGHRITVVAPDGEVLGESTRDGAGLEAMENHAGRPEIRAALAGREGQAVRWSETLGADLLYVARRTAGGEVFRVAVPLAQIDAGIGRIQRGIFGIGALAVLLAIVLSIGFTVAVARPLRRLHAAANALAAGDLSVRIRSRGSDELAQLATALDTLAEELQRRLKQLEDERAEMQALIDAMSEGVIAISAQGTVRRANPAAKRIFSLADRTQGLAPEAVARRPEFLRLVRRALQGQQVSATELTSDGRAILATAHPLPDGGAVLVFLDVSELRRLEGVRRDFVANASHELKTPLTAIRGYSETLLDPDIPPETMRRFAEIVRANADRLQRIVDDLLDLSRLESGGWAIDPAPLSLTQAATEAWAAQPPPLSAKKIELVLDFDPDADEVVADSAAVRQIFTNLFSNAIRYTPEGGSVTVRARPARHLEGAADDRGWARIEVEDTGSGIPAAHLPRIFERFYRVDPARSRVEGGTGLGLAIVKHLVEAHGGRIGADSEIGQGTTIRLTLPLAESTSASRYEAVTG